jgi:hypothetical protein
MLRVTICVVLLAAPGLARAQRPEGGPRGPAPRVMAVRVNAAGQPVLSKRVVEAVPEIQEVEVKVGDRTEKRQVTVHRQVVREVEMRLDVKGVEVFEARGRRIDPADVPARLKKPTAVLVSADGNPVDPFYLRLARPDTLVVVAPALASPDVPKKLPDKGELPDKR